MRTPHVNGLLDGARRERALVCALAVALVILRGFVATSYEGFFFDSDQAIVGLMARRLSNFQQFPLFYYGLNYLLAVEAWIIAPVFWIARSSVAAMRLPFVALNALAAVWLIRSLIRYLALRPGIAFVTAVPFIIPTPAAANQLLDLAGACVEPFIYVLLLWKLRGRPLAFGALLAVAFLHREFAIFTVPALVLVEGRRWLPWSRENLRRLARAAGGFGIVWLIVDDLKMHLAGGALALQVVSLRGQMCLDAAELVRHARALLTEALPALYGARRMPLSAFRMNSPVVAGWPIVGWAVAAALALMLARLAWGQSQGSESGVTVGGPGQDLGFGPYLAWVAALVACAYPLSCNVTPGGLPLFRYLLLALLLPVGCAAAFMQRERSPLLRGVVTSVFVLWGAANLVDNVRVIRAAIADPPLSEHRVLVDYLIDQRIHYARAIYWDAYVVDFLARERVITASVDVIRIPEYQKSVDEHARAAVTLERLPCEGRERVASWCIQRP